LDDCGALNGSHTMAFIIALALTAPLSLVGKLVLTAFAVGTRTRTRTRTRPIVLKGK
jgi:hypothetical protein